MTDLLNPPPAVAFFFLSAAALVAFCAVAAYWHRSQRRAYLKGLERVHASQRRSTRVMWDEESDLEQAMRAGKVGDLSRAKPNG